MNYCDYYFGQVGVCAILYGVKMFIYEIKYLFLEVLIIFRLIGVHPKEEIKVGVFWKALLTSCQSLVTGEGRWWSFYWCNQ